MDNGSAGVASRRSAEAGEARAMSEQQEAPSVAEITEYLTDNVASIAEIAAEFDKKPAATQRRVLWMLHKNKVRTDYAGEAQLFYI